MNRLLSSLVFCVASTVLLAHCGSPVQAQADGGSDSGSSLDSGSDAGATFDGGLDGGAGAGIDGGADAGTAFDAGMDGGAARDGGDDGGSDGRSTPDSGARDGGTPDSGVACPFRPVVNEIQTGSNAGAADEWVEIYNPCPNPIDLSGWGLFYRSANNNLGGPDTRLFTFAGSVGAGVDAYRLITGQSYSGAAPSDGLLIGGLASSGGAVGLRDALGTLVDSVAYTTLSTANTFTEGSPAPNPPNGSSIGRAPNGTDTNDNSRDFIIWPVATPRAANR